MVDPRDYKRIITIYKTKVFSLCYYHLNKNTDLANETVNDVFMVLYNKWDSLDINSDLTSYLFAVARNCSKHNLEKYYRINNKELSLDQLREEGRLTDPAVCDEYFAADEPQADEAAGMEMVKNSLPPEYRELFEYRYIQKKTLKETAELTKTPYSTVRMRLDKLEPLIRKAVKKIYN